MRGPHIGAALAVLLLCAASLLACVSCADDIDSKAAQVEVQTQATTDYARGSRYRAEMPPAYEFYNNPGPSMAPPAYDGYDAPRPAPPAYDGYNNAPRQAQPPYEGYSNVPRQVQPPYEGYNTVPRQVQPPYEGYNPAPRQAPPAYDGYNPAPRVPQPGYDSYTMPNMGPPAYQGYSTTPNMAPAPHKAYSAPQPDYTPYYPDTHHHKVDTCKCYPSCSGLDQCLLGVCAQSASQCNAIDDAYGPNYIVLTYIDGTTSSLVFIDPASPSVGVGVGVSNADVAGPVLVDVSTLSGTLLDSFWVVGTNCASTPCGANCTAPPGVRTVTPDPITSTACVRVRLPADEDCTVLKVDVTAACREPCAVDALSPDACSYGVAVGCSTRNTDYCAGLVLRRSGKLGSSSMFAWPPPTTGGVTEKKAEKKP